MGSSKSRAVEVSSARNELLVSGSMHEIIPGLYLGDRTAGEQIARGPRQTEIGIKYLLNVSDSIYYSPFSATIQMQQVPLADGGSTTLTPALLFECFQFIDAALKPPVEASGPKDCVLVHCAIGANRSATVVIAYLMQANGWSFQTAHSFVKSKRPIVRPVDRYSEQLTAIEPLLRKRQKEWCYSFDPDKELKRQSEQQRLMEMWKRPAGEPVTDGTDAEAPETDASATAEASISATSGADNVEPTSATPSHDASESKIS